jgi:hypothetical protein
MAGSLSWTDLRRLFRGSGGSVLTNRFFYLFTAGNFSIMVLLYLFLAETGRVRYDGILTAFIIGLAPSAMLRTTLFETPQGRAIGLERLYDKLLSWVDERLMMARYKALQARINLVAYNNSQNAMREALFDLYRNHPAPAQRARLIRELDEDLRDEPDYLERRRSLARRLLRWYDWEQLKAEGFVPPQWDESRLVDPRQIVRRVARHSAQHPAKVNLIRDESARQMQHLKSRNRKRYAELKDFLRTELEDAIAIEGELNVHIRFLFVLLGFDFDWFLKNDLLTEQEIEEEKQRMTEQFPEPLKAKVRRWLRRTESRRVGARV